MEEVKDFLSDTGIVTCSEAANAGLSKDSFYRFVEKNGLERIGHGVYATADTWVDELYVLHQRCPSAVFSHEEALYYHGLTDREPMIHTLTIYTGYNTKRLTESGCKVYTVKKELLDLGKITVTDQYGNDIPMYDLERTICDAVRSRNNMEMQDFTSALKTYARRKDKDLNRLMDYAKRFRVDKIIRRYLEVLL